MLSVVYWFYNNISSIYIFYVAKGLIHTLSKSKTLTFKEFNQGSNHLLSFENTNTAWEMVIKFWQFYQIITHLHTEYDECDASVFFYGKREDRKKGG